MSKTNNEMWTERFREIMPWGSSTSSKAPSYQPEEPGVIVKGKGCRVWDADGKEYIDYRNGLGPISLGYGFPAVDDAIREQLESGIVFGQPHPVECEVAEMLSKIIPCAELVRFLKTGGEALAACIRIARYYTGRDHIIHIGYNGWLNGLASGGMVLPGQVSKSAPAGVPESLSALHHTCKWNDIETIEAMFKQTGNQIAAVMISADYPNMEAGSTFYPKLREITERYGALLIFDEIVTGFRIAKGGVQDYFGVTPDLTVFGKAIANGMPLSVYAGKREVMKKCDRGGAVISSTFGGETLSLAAAKATIQTYENYDVIGHIWKQGEKLWKGLNSLFVQHSIPAVVKGFWPCPTFQFGQTSSINIAEKFFRSAYRNGVSLYNVSYVNFSHSDSDIEETLRRLDLVCREIEDLMKTEG